MNGLDWTYMVKYFLLIISIKKKVINLLTKLKSMVKGLTPMYKIKHYS